MEKDWRKPTLGQRWSDARPTKTIVFYDLIEKNGEKQEVKLMEMTLKKRP
jgi:hypothetical protein